MRVAGRFCAASMLSLLASASFPATDTRSTPVQLTVDSMPTPLGIDVAMPRFGWQMATIPGLRGQWQTAYQLQVKDRLGAVLWDTGKVAAGQSIGIAYAGAPLKSASRYDWSVTVWDQAGNAASAASWFETGLMNSRIEAWEGAQWIGGSGDDRVLYAHYLPLFDLQYTLTIAPGSARAAVVLAANDPRLMDRHKNIYQLENRRNQSYFKLELDISRVDGSANGRARLNFYRAGYAPADQAATPINSVEITVAAIHSANKHAPHRIAIHNEYGMLTVTLNASSDFYVKDPSRPQLGNAFVGPPAGATAALNPLGTGHDYLTYGMLGEIGFSLDAGQRARISSLTVSNTVAPGTVLFSEELAEANYSGIYRSFAADPSSGLRIVNDAYELDGGSAGLFIVADPSRNAMPMLRTHFATTAKPIRTARLYVTARGIYEIYLNGQRVGDDYYNPGLTQYNRTHLYQTYDVTALIRRGSNALGAMLGEGWWSGLLSFGDIWNYFGDRQSLLAKLVIEYADNSRQVIASNDQTWKYFAAGPVIYSSLSQGEVYDARREAAVNGWSTPAYRDESWHAAVVVPLAGTTNHRRVENFRNPNASFDHDDVALIAQIGNSAGIYRTLSAQSVKEVRPGVYVYDMGQNMVGVPRLRFTQGLAGRRVTLRYAEMLYPALPESGKNVGMLMTENYRAALSQDIYIMKDGAQVFQPRFTSHGYQYIEITGVDSPLPLSAVQGLVISSVRSLTADYVSSNTRVNRLWSNLVWSNIGNFLSIPTDCPQRNERMGWSGDISVFARTATYVSNAAPFLRRHLRAMRDVQEANGRFTDIAPIGGGFGGVLWGSAGMTVPWELYQQYGDIAVLAEHYAAMARYVGYLDTTLDAGTGLSSDATLGDWLGPQDRQLGSAFLATAYHVYDLEIMARSAEVLHKPQDAARYWASHRARKAFFNRTFVNADKQALGLVGGPSLGVPAERAPPREFKLADTQSAYAVGLALNAFNEEHLPHMARHLAAAVERRNRDDNGVERPAYSLMTGFIGTAWISTALSRHGRSDLAYRLLQNNQYPSWLYAIDQGATTIWERLNGYTADAGFGGNNSMNSFNHYSFGAVGQWLMAHSLGIEREQPGFKRFVLQPEPDTSGSMTSARGHYDSPYGRIESAWELRAGQLHYTATVPANTTATLRLPARAGQAVREGNQAAAQAIGVRYLGYESGKAVFEVQSGQYRFTAAL